MKNMIKQLAKPMMMIFYLMKIFKMRFEKYIVIFRFVNIVHEI